MSTRQQRPSCRLLLNSPPRQLDLSQPMLDLLRGDSSINLAELAEAITADLNLCIRVMEAAVEECGCPALTVEQAIVVLGRERLAAQVLRTLGL